MITTPAVSAGASAAPGAPSPALQGPLNLHSESLHPSPHPACALAALHYEQPAPASSSASTPAALSSLRRAAPRAPPSPLGANATPLPGPPRTPTQLAAATPGAEAAQQLLLDGLPALPALLAASTTALVSARADGRVWAHVLLEPVLPRWAAGGLPGGGGRGGPWSPPGALLSGGGGGAGARLVCSAEGGGAPAAVLLDTVELPVAAARQAGGYGAEEEEEEDEAEGGGRGGGLLHGLVLQDLVGPGAQTLVAAHASGCWVVELSWLPLVARQLRAAHAAAAGEGLGGGAPAALPDLALLPAPLVLEVAAGAEGAAAAAELGAAAAAGGTERLRGVCCLRDVFVGRAVLLLPERSGAGGGALRCVRHALLLAAAQETLSLEERQQQERQGQQQKGAGEAGGKAGAPAAAGKAAAAGGGGGGALSEVAKEVVDSAIQAVYSDLLVAPPAPRLPTLSGA